jgi:D-glycero-alpha-D-manno-heptose-7-phosphate kinase
MKDGLAQLPSVHSRAPLRLGLAGGGTDVAPYSDLYGGRVLNATISLFTHCHIERLDGRESQFLATDFDQKTAVPCGDHEQMVEPLRLHRAAYARIVRDYLGRAVAPALRVTTYSDAPPGSGVGSSSALVVAMVQAYVEMFQLPLGDYDVAHLAYEIERLDCALAGGKQDQYAAAFGGFNFMEFGADDRVVVNPLRLKRELADDLESRLLLYFTGRSRDSAGIIEAQVQSTRDPESDAVQAMHALRQAADEMKEALLKGRISDVLRILGQSWITKKRAASAISNPRIERIADAALTAGAGGLKISGAGGGGFMMIAAEPAARFDVIRALEPLGGRFFSFTFVEQGVQSWKSH